VRWNYLPLKASRSGTSEKRAGLVRFFSSDFFYAGTGVCAVLIQIHPWAHALVRLGLGGRVASHPVIVGTAALSGFAGSRWCRFSMVGVLPRGAVSDIAIRNSIFRA